MGRVNPLRTDDPSISGNPFSRANLTRPFDNIKDMAALKGTSEFLELSVVTRARTSITLPTASKTRITARDPSRRTSLYEM